jgi:hypothetical protein
MRISAPSSSGAGALLAHDHAFGTVAFHADGDLLDVEHDVGHVLAHARDGREFMQDAVDLHRRHRRAAKGREQHAAQRVAEGEAEAALERLGHERGEALALALELDPVGLDQLLPVLLDHEVFSFRRHHPIVTADGKRRPRAREEPGRRGCRYVLRRGASCADGIRCAGWGSRHE